jgi:hypothetical protein
MSNKEQLIVLEENDETNPTETMMVELYKRRKEWQSKSRRALLCAFFRFVVLQDDGTEVLVCCICYKDKNVTPENVPKISGGRRGRGRMNYKSSSGTSSLHNI